MSRHYVLEIVLDIGAIDDGQLGTVAMNFGKKGRHKQFFYKDGRIELEMFRASQIEHVPVGNLNFSHQKLGLELVHLQRQRLHVALLTVQLKKDLHV